ncbi:hypothetical protein [Rheinheimera sp.]|uniref:hypothetical protein n=1 Tax=Rheinheimera sp. TaxID=1869214 RepID=UPI0027B97C6B|nr:hypothetical protein [Rheinheimera sp.]
MRIGTKKNPIKLVNESISRRLLLAHCKNTSSKHFDFHSLPNFGEDCFIENVLFNPHLTLPEVKLAIYFFGELADGGQIFTTSFAEDFRPALLYGDVFEVDEEFIDGMAIGSDESLRSEVAYSNEGYYTSLPLITSRMGMKLTSQRLINLLRRLHDFGYVTVTDITPDNSYEPPNKADKKVSRARLRHIRLHNGMRKKDLTGRWLSKRLKPKKPKQALTNQKPV